MKRPLEVFAIFLISACVVSCSDESYERELISAYQAAIEAHELGAAQYMADIHREFVNDRKKVRPYYQEADSLYKEMGALNALIDSTPALYIAQYNNIVAQIENIELSRIQGSLHDPVAIGELSPSLSQVQRWRAHAQLAKQYRLIMSGIRRNVGPSCTWAISSVTTHLVQEDSICYLLFESKNLEEERLGYILLDSLNYKGIDPKQGTFVEPISTLGKLRLEQCPTGPVTVNGRLLLVHSQLGAVEQPFEQMITQAH